MNFLFIMCFPSNLKINLGKDYVYFFYSLLAQMVKSLPSNLRREFDPWVLKISWRRKWQPTPVFLLGKSHGLRSLAAIYS